MRSLAPLLCPGVARPVRKTLDLFRERIVGEVVEVRVKPLLGDASAKLD